MAAKGETRQCVECGCDFTARNAQHSWCSRSCRRATRRAYSPPVRSAALTRDNHTCQLCGVVACDVHHITPICFGGSPSDLANLISLCKPCHQAQHATWSLPYAA